MRSLNRWSGLLLGSLALTCLPWNANAFRPRSQAIENQANRSTVTHANSTAKSIGEASELAKAASERDARMESSLASFPEPWHYPFESPDKAALAVLRYLSRNCSQDPHERGGYITAVTFRKRPTVYLATPYKIGDIDRLDFGPPPPGAIATYHTHPFIEDFAYDKPSTLDLKEAERRRLIYYIGTPTRVLACEPQKQIRGKRRPKIVVREVSRLAETEEEEKELSARKPLPRQNNDD